MKTQKSYRKKKIKDLPASSRPREKLEYKGAENLSAAELLAILLGTGTSKKNAIHLAETVLRYFPLSKLPTITFSELTTIAGVGKTKASRILAAVELGNRIFALDVLAKTTIFTTQDVLNQLKDIADKKQEYLLVLYLNARHEMIQKETVALGSLNTTLIEPRDIFRPALLTPCSEFIIAHNHPSGDPTPSSQDIEFTKTLLQAGELMGISLIDHLIITRSDYFSFREHGLLL